jgi:3-oxo-4,17-pregnadiene-20-carboxyl-CoA hydratase alpha subunit
VTDRHARIMAEAERIKALGEASESVAPYEVNQATIGTWLDAIGYDNERFRRGEAPPSMAQVWTMPGLGRRRPPDDPLSRMTELLTEEGYTAVLGTNCEQSYERYLRIGELVRVTSALESVAGPKDTAMGEGYFVTSRSTWYVDDEVVATMLFRVLKFIPKESA